MVKENKKDFQEFAQKKTGIKEGRTKVASSFRHDIVAKTNEILSEFEDFIDGTRLLFLIHRNKEGGETNNTKTRKIITRSQEEFRQELLKLVDEKERSDIPYRIYSSCNPRNFAKAIRKFKFEMLEADYYDDEQMRQFYWDIRNRFVGCLGQPGSAEDSMFMFDCDSTDAWNTAVQQLSILNIEIIKQYKTKNGWHIISPAFNPNLFDPISDCTIVKDGLLLLNY